MAKPTKPAPVKDPETTDSEKLLNKVVVTADCRMSYYGTALQLTKGQILEDDVARYAYRTGAPVKATG